ncbi:uncharacterized protein [Asterias amurensis]|uniref:uncharacterized protein n=1 Tax=Asterias amurensis TaxID=7602 RepID=UPI003AB1E296
MSPGRPLATSANKTKHDAQYEVLCFNSPMAKTVDKTKYENPKPQDSDCSYGKTEPESHKTNAVTTQFCNTTQQAFDVTTLNCHIPPKGNEYTLAVVETRVSPIYQDHILDRPTSKERIKTKENTSSRVNKQNPCNYRNSEITGMSASTKPEPKPRRKTSAQGKTDARETLTNSTKQMPHQRHTSTCTDELNQKGQETERSGNEYTLAVVETRVSPIYQDHIPDRPTSKERIKTKENTSSIVNKQNPCNYRNSEITGMSASTKPEPKPRRKTSAQGKTDAKETLTNSTKQMPHQRHTSTCTDELNQKGQETERSAPKIKSKPKHKQQTPGKELPAIKKHLKQFKEHLQREVFNEQLKQQGGSDITSKVLADLNFTGRMMDKRGGSLQLTSHEGSKATFLQF